MSKLGGLINGQDIAFDTHQAGDGQEIKWQNVHLEKRLHRRGGKVRFPLLGQENPSNSGMSDKDFERVTNEVRNVLKKNETLVKKLAKQIVSELKRFSSGQATVKDAERAAERFAEYFGLNTLFHDSLAKSADKHLISFTSTHYQPACGTFYAIHQSKDQIVFQKRERGIFRNNVFVPWSQK